jgi:N-6 DNA methylase
MYKDFYSEADVETKYVYNYLLKTVLDINDNKIKFHVPVEIKLGRETKTKEADVVIKNENNENLIVIDSKAPNEKLEKYYTQIDSYAFSLETPISILTNGKKTIMRMYLFGNKKEIIFDQSFEEMEKDNYKKFKDIIQKFLDYNENKKIKISKTFTEDNKDIEKIIDYRRLFREIHSKIRSIDKLDPTASFDEFSKILFIKIIHDKLINENKNGLDLPTIKKLYQSENKRKEYIDKWFQENIEIYYPEIFPNNEKITLSFPAIEYILNELNEKFNLQDSFTDVKGKAFEEFLPSQLRGKGLGQFFTPRTIVEFMINLADISINDKILDFSTGSGGFLIKAFDYKKKLLDNLPNEYFEYVQKNKEVFLEDIKKQIFGIDAEPRAVRTAKMNMLLWGDGKQIEHGNGLDIKNFKNKKYLINEYSESDDNSGVDIILANPPFGSVEENQKILEQYELSTLKKNKKTGEIFNEKEKTEHLFIEKAYKMLKPNGKLLIVLPEGIFSNSNDKVRNFILDKFIITNIIKLPKYAFVMSGVDTINTVILIAIKKEKDYVETEFEINFSYVNKLGYEPSGKMLKNGYETSDLKIVEEKIKSKNTTTIISNPYEYSKMEFGNMSKNEYWKKNLVKFLNIKFNTPPKRLDPTFFFFEEETKEILKKYKKIKLNKENIKKYKLTDEELNSDYEKTYSYVSVTKNLKGTVEEIEEKTVDELLVSNSKPQKIFKNDIVYNPYRINTGSVILVTDDNNYITSDAYVTIRNLKEVIPKYLLLLLKTPFMKYQIQVLASGSIRDNFSIESLKNLKIPNISIDKQKEIVKKTEEMFDLIKKNDLENDNYIKKISDFFD